MHAKLIVGIMLLMIAGVGCTATVQDTPVAAAQSQKNTPRETGLIAGTISKYYKNGN